MRAKLNDENESSINDQGAGIPVKEAIGEGVPEGTESIGACEGGVEVGRREVGKFTPKGTSITLYGCGRRDGSDVNNSMALVDFYALMLGV